MHNDYKSTDKLQFKDFCVCVSLRLLYISYFNLNIYQYMQYIGAKKS